MNTALFQHKTSGDIYGVIVGKNGELLQAAGPLHYTEQWAALEGNINDEPETREWMRGHPHDFTLAPIPPKP